MSDENNDIETIVDDILSPETMKAIDDYQAEFNDPPVITRATGSIPPIVELVDLTRRNPYLPPAYFAKKATKITDFMEPNKKKRRLVSRSRKKLPPMPPAPRIRPVPRDLTAIEVIDLTESDAKIIFDLSRVDKH